MRIAIVTLCLLESLVVLQGVLAHFDGFLTVDQMRGRAPAGGMPFVWHLAMLGDAAIVAPLASALVLGYGRTWSRMTIIKSLALAVVATVAMHWVYLQGAIPSLHVYDHALTPAGVVHFVFMAGALAIFTAFFLFTPEALPRHARAASVALVLHVFLGTHLAFGFIKRFIPLDWYPGDPLRDPAAWLTFLGVVTFLIFRTRQMAQALARGPGVFSMRTYYDDQRHS
jgi:hypothetical protein